MSFLGLDDAEFIRGQVPMTKQEIRILTLAKAHIAPDSVVYDVGAGTGSLSIEAARLAMQGKVYAIEKNAAGIELIKANMAKFAVTNIEVIHGEAPAAMRDLPPGDVVLIGGSGRQLAAILDLAHEKLNHGGRVVINSVTIQTIAATLDYLRANEDKFSYEAIQVQVSRLEPVGGYDMLKAANPIFIVTCEKI